MIFGMERVLYRESRNLEMAIHMLEEDRISEALQHLYGTLDGLKAIREKNFKGAYDNMLPPTPKPKKTDEKLEKTLNQLEYKRAGIQARI